MTKLSLVCAVSSLLIASMTFSPSAPCAEALGCQMGYYTSFGLQALEKGDEALKVRDYAMAWECYKRACDMIPNPQGTSDPENHRAAYTRALAGFCDASCWLAEQRIAERRYDEAESILHIVLDDRYNPRYKRAHILLAQFENPPLSNRPITPEMRANLEKVKKLMVEAQGFYDTAQYDKAFKRCDQVLNIDPYNKAARIMEEQIDRAKSDFAVGIQRK